MDSETVPSNDGDTALKIHNKRIKKFKRNTVRTQKNQGFRVDQSIKKLTNQYSKINSDAVKTFEDFPLSERTLEGLKSNSFNNPTDIQKQTIGLALQGHDILGAAKTGSGKTLAFLVPILELLYRNKIGFLDGMSALVISPTRELAYQTYNVLRKVGAQHDFSAGLIIGGTDLKEESERISKTHVVICTPGRLQQHMEQTWGFNADSVLILVLDECDKILDLGFQDTMNSILEYVPQTRQTLMFSATQTKSVKDLARVGLKSPVFVSVHEGSEFSTPASLEQNYLVCELQDKLNTLWFFIKNHLKSKILVFIQSCKQVRYIHSALERIRPGVKLLALHGNMKQIKRVKTYEEFCRKQFVVLFATDIASRGLDFPGVNWVVQYDAPENADTYIHRVGRTARYDKDGEALLFLLPSEKEEMLSQLADKKIPIEEIKVNPKKMGNIQRKLAAQLVEDPELKEFAKASFMAYLKGYFLMRNKKMFDVQQLDTNAYAQSLGLSLIPKIRFLKKQEILKKKQAPKTSAIDNNNVAFSSEESDQSDSDASMTNDSDSESNESDTSKNTKSEEFKLAEGNSDSEDDGLLTLKKVSKSEEEETEQDKLTQLRKMLEEKSKQKGRAISKRDLAAAMKKKGITSSKIVFSDAETSSGSDEELGETSPGQRQGNRLDIKAAKMRMEKQDLEDKQDYRAKIKRKHQERRWKEKERSKKPRVEEDDEDEPVVLLGGESDNDIEENVATSAEEDSSPETDLSLSKNKISRTAVKKTSMKESDSESDDEYNEKSSQQMGALNSLDDDEAFALQLLQS